MSTKTIELKEGGFVVSQNGVWVEGVYATEAAARLAPNVAPQVLSDKWEACLNQDQNGYLTEGDLI